jgi:predicted nucleic acid-binding protein
MSIWITNTSPLIFLARLNRLDLLQRSAEEIITPPAVLREIAEHQDESAQKVAEARQTWLLEREVQEGHLLRVLRTELGDGEAEAIALALEVGAARVVLDDLDARRMADRLQLKTVGTLGLLLAAKLRGEIPSLREEIGRLRREGFRVAPALVEAVLREAGEEGISPRPPLL